MSSDHWMKEKYDLSVDNRQIVSGLIGALVVMGTIFVLGVVVGKKVATDQRATRAPDLLTALDEKSELIDQVRDQPALTFPNVLTNGARPELAEPTAPSSEKPVAAKARPSPEQPAQSEPPARKRSAEPARSRELFTLQLLSSQSRAEADGFATQLKLRGYRPYVVKAEIPDRGVWYRVRLGSFSSKEQANKLMEDLKKKKYYAFVTGAQ